MAHPLVELFIGLVPQKDDDPVRLYNWRWKSVVLGILGLGLGAYASNLVPYVKPPYAMAASVDDLKLEFQRKFESTNQKLDQANGQLTVVMGQIKDGQIRSLNNDLIDARRYQCRSINSEDKSALPFWTNRLQSLKFSYQNLTGESWPDLPCSSF